MLVRNRSGFAEFGSAFLFSLAFWVACMHVSDVFCLNLSGRSRKHIKHELIFRGKETPISLDFIPS